METFFFKKPKKDCCEITLPISGEDVVYEGMPLIKTKIKKGDNYEDILMKLEYALDEVSVDYTQYKFSNIGEGFGIFKEVESGNNVVFKTLTTDESILIEDSGEEIKLTIAQPNNYRIFSTTKEARDYLNSDESKVNQLIYIQEEEGRGYTPIYVINSDKSDLELFSTIHVTKTSQLVNDGEDGTSKYVEEKDAENYEKKENKQNDLTPDGTGVKYPTVDAINEALERLESDKNFVYDQTSPSKEWDIIHNLNKKPSCTIIDSAGTVVEGKIIINDGVRLLIEFNAPFTGSAILN